MDCNEEGEAATVKHGHQDDCSAQESSEIKKESGDDNEYSIDHSGGEQAVVKLEIFEGSCPIHKTDLEDDREDSIDHSGGEQAVVKLEISEGSCPILKADLEVDREGLIDHSGGEQALVKLEIFEGSCPILKTDLKDDREDSSAGYNSDENCSAEVPVDGENGCLESVEEPFVAEHVIHSPVTLELGLSADGEGAGRDVGSDATELGQQDAAPSGSSVPSRAEPLPHRCDLCGITFPTAESVQVHFSTHSKSLGGSSEDSKTDHSGSNTAKYEQDASLSGSDPDEHDRVKRSSASSKRSSNNYQRSSRKNKRKRSSSADESAATDQASISDIGHKSDKSSDTDAESEGGPGVHKCAICGNRYKYARGLKTHLQTHSATKAHQCDICRKAYVKRDVMLRHRREVHLGVGKCKTDEEKWNCTCDMCGKSFASLNGMRKHKQLHTVEKCFKCDICDRAFVLKGDMTRHYRGHSQERTHECKICNRKFARNHTLKKHLRRHTGEKPYTCEFCGKSFARQDVFILHDRAHTGERPYKCDICGASFEMKGPLGNHLKAGNCCANHAGRRKRRKRGT